MVYSVSENISFAIHKVDKFKEDDRFIFLEIHLALVGLNRNGSFISKDSYELSKDTLGYIPICSALNYLRSDFLEHEGDKLKCIGVILSNEDNNYRYETVIDEDTEAERTMVVVNGIIFKEYAKQESSVILASMSKGTSLEIEVLEKHFEDGIFYFDKFRYQSLVILGDSYLPGMEGCHLEVASNYKQLYSKDIEKIKHVFSLFKADKIDNKKGLSAMNFTEREVDKVEFNKIEFAEKLGLTANEVWDAIKGTCDKETYKIDGYEYRKYWMRDYDDSYVYVVDYEDEHKLKALPYVMDGKECKVDFANAKNARMRPFVDESNLEEFVSFADGFNYFAKMKENEFAKEKKGLDIRFKELEASFTKEKEAFTAQLEEKQNSIIKIGQEMDVLKTQLTAKETELKTFKAENEKLKEQVVSFAKEKKLAEAESIFAKYSTRISEEEKAELFSKLDEISDIKDFEKEVKAFVCDKYEEELKGKSETTTFSQLGVNKPESQFGNKVSWIDYYEEYKGEK